MQRLRSLRAKILATKHERKQRRDEERATSDALSLAFFENDPIGFARVVFGLDLWEGQQEICTAVTESDATACKSGHKCGKSTAAALLAWWFAATRPSARVIITAPTDRQVKQVVWREVRRLWRESRKSTCLKCGARTLAKRCPVAGCNGELQPSRYILPEPALAPDTGIVLPDDSQVLGFTAGNPEAMAGISSPEMLYIVDEASGVEETIFEAIEGNLAGGAKIVLISNPTQTSGQFYRAFHKERSEWRLVTISSEDTPNVKSGKKLVPGLATREWVEKRRRIWGVDDPRYQVRVRGNFPRTAANAVVSIEAIERAKARREETKPEGILKIGVDVARFGDDSSVAQPVRGLYAYEPRAVNGHDTIQVAGMVLEIVRDPKILPKGEKCEIYIDVGGGYGGGVADQLRYAIEEDPELGLAVTVVEVHPSSSADNPHYDLKRDELWFGIREFLEEGGTLPDHDELESDLLAPTYWFTRRSRIRVEAKDEIKKRLGRSPDFGDALGLAVTQSGAGAGFDDLDDEDLLGVGSIATFGGGRGF